MKVKRTYETPIYFDHDVPDSLRETLDTRHKITQLMNKTRGDKTMAQILIIIDDFADEPTCTRQSNMLRTLYTRGRQRMISTITATQQVKALHPIIRVNATDHFVYRLNNMKGLDTFVDEVSTVVEKN